MKSGCGGVKRGASEGERRAGPSRSRRAKRTRALLDPRSHEEELQITDHGLKSHRARHAAGDSRAHHRNTNLRLLSLQDSAPPLALAPLRRHLSLRPRRSPHRSMHPFSVLTAGIFVAGYITARWDLVTRLYELAIFAWDHGVVVGPPSPILFSRLHC